MAGLSSAAEQLSASATAFAHTLANEPSVGLYYVAEHVQRSVPELVEAKRELAQGAERLRGADLDAGFDLEDMALATSGGTQRALSNAIALARGRPPRTEAPSSAPKVAMLVHPTLTLPWTLRPVVPAPPSAEAAARELPAAASLSTFAAAEPGGWQLAAFRCVAEAERADHAATEADVPGRRGSAGVLDASVVLLAARRPVDHATFAPFSTSGYVYVPSTFTLLSRLFRLGSEACGRRVVELGSGLGGVAGFLQQLDPPPRRLVATDGDARVVPLLARNVAANHGGSATAVRELRWGEALEPDLARSFDLVVAADTIFDCRPPVAGQSRGAPSDEGNRAQLDNFFRTAAALLDRGGRLVLASEPRDALGFGLMRQRIVEAAAAAGLGCVERHERRLLGQARPEWETDLHVFALE